MPKVLIFKENLLPSSETFILSQMCALKRFTPKIVGLEPTQAGLPLPHLPILLSSKVSFIARYRAKVYRRLGFAPAFHRRAKLFKPDLIHAHFANGGVAALPLARALKVPLAVTLHGADVTIPPRQPNAYKHLGECAGLFFCVSDFIRGRAIELGLPTEKLVTHYIGIDLEQFRESGIAEQSGQNVLFVGRLVEKKGCDYLLRAMSLVQETNSECELTVIGDGPLRPALERLAKSLQIRCHFLGTQSGNAVRDALRRARIFCAPSVTAESGDSEGLGIVFAESQAMGVPVVSTHHGGIPEVVLHGKTGLLVPERDYYSLAKSISTLLNDDELWKSFHQAAPQHIASNFDLRKQTPLLEKHYAALIAKR